MLPDLSYHLHTEECNFLIEIFNDCRHNRPFFKRAFMRECSYWYTAVSQCLHQERALRRTTNPKYGQRYVEHRRLPEERYTPALKKLKAEGKLILGGKSSGGGCSI